MKDNIETKILFDEQLINFIKNIKIDINNLL
jgi:hypothetical protein